MDLALPHTRDGLLRGIATLGPAGTSSEQSARYLSDYLSASWQDCRIDKPVPIDLYPQYEEAAQAVVNGRSSLLLVANAYHAISTFYMDSKLSIVGAYCFDTPQYGIASRSGVLPDGELTIASHPAPIPLINQLLAGTKASAGRVVRMDSTSAAARSAAGGDVDVALTTAPAASLYGLKFVTRTRNIRMLWSVFAAATDERRFGEL
ncbi:bacilysin biosynthesis protein BacA [Nocardia transvalensis]|nr:bacilysin biosynthesis protein BacA [Nocardia transvalensis]